MEMNALFSILSTNIYMKQCFFETLSQLMLSIHDTINCHYKTVEILLLQEQEYAAIYSTISLKPGCEGTNTLSYLPVYKKKKNHIWMFFQSGFRDRNQTERRNCWCGNKLQAVDVELAQTLDPELTRRRRRRREVVVNVGSDVSSSLLGGLFPLLDVGDLQDGQQKLESILDVGSTVGRLRADQRGFF